MLLEVRLFFCRVLKYRGIFVLWLNIISLICVFLVEMLKEFMIVDINFNIFG